MIDPFSSPPRFRPGVVKTVLPMKTVSQAQYCLLLGFSMREEPVLLESEEVSVALVRG